MNRFLVAISFISGILTIGDITWKIAKGQEYNLFAVILVLFAVVSIQTILWSLMELKIDLKDKYIPIIFYFYIPLVSLSSIWGYFNNDYGLNPEVVFPEIDSIMVSFPFLEIDSVMESFSVIDSIKSSLVAIDSIKLSMPIADALKLSLIVIVTMTLYIYWASLFNVTFHKEGKFIGPTYGVPAIIVLGVIMYKYVFLSYQIDGKLWGYLILIFVFMSLALVAKKLPLNKRNNKFNYEHSYKNNNKFKYENEPDLSQTNNTLLIVNEKIKYEENETKN